MDLLHIQTIEPGFLASAPEPLDLGLGCAIPNLGMKEYCTDGTADERELFIDIGRTIVRVKFRRNGISGHCFLEDRLKVGCGVAIKELSADDQTRMIVNDTDGINATGSTVFCDVREVTGVCLPHLSKSILLKGFSVLHRGIAGGFEVVMPYETLDCAYADSGWN